MVEKGKTSLKGLYKTTMGYNMHEKDDPFIGLILICELVN